MIAENTVWLTSEGPIPLGYGMKIMCSDMRIPRKENRSRDALLGVICGS